MIRRLFSAIGAFLQSPLGVVLATTAIWHIVVREASIPIMTERFIRESHAKNIKVEPWTADDPELMKQYIEWGVDGIITDRPDLMMNVLGN